MRSRHASYYDGSRTLPTHAELVRILAQALQFCGETITVGLRVEAGMPDLYTDRCIYEVKPALTLSAVQRGIGQLLMYGQDLPGRELVLIGFAHTGCRMKGHVERLGVSMRILRDDLSFMPPTELEARSEWVEALVGCSKDI